ncbi:sarcosine oxidase [Phlyctema vagabunda]|uniref:Sarcosine oxidase n=1 Tax=Phlyctema vagabunda TaxID=108571 RepID=A0ABR4PAW4_9HELO
MATRDPEVQFHFINSSVDKKPTGPQDGATRALIRKQAMKKASAARKQNGSYGKHNLRQLPVFVDEPVLQPPTTYLVPVRELKSYQPNAQSRKADATTAEKRQVANRVQRPRNTNLELPSNRPPVVNSVPPSMSQTPFRLMTMKFGMNILDMSNLTTFHVSRVTRMVLSQDPTEVMNLLRYNQWSFFSYLPDSYDKSLCVRFAVDCVVARVRQILSPAQEWLDAQVIKSYVRALGCLQRALDSPQLVFTPDVLYATEILALYELLSPSEPTAWIKHSAGAADLIRLRGPKRYKTEFEKSLFMAHVGAIATESLLNNERCFLEEEAWRDVFRSVIVDDEVISDRSEAVISLFMHKSKIAGICHDATAGLTSPTPPPMEAIIQLTDRAVRLRQDILQWRYDHAHLLGSLTDISLGSAEDDKRCKVIGVYFSCIIVTTRLVSSLLADQRVALENETQEYVEQVFELERRVARLRPEASLFIALTVAVAQATRATANLWRGEDKNGVMQVEQNPVIETWKFERYCALMGRKFPAVET